MRSAMWVGGSIGRRGFPMIGTGKRSLSTYIKQFFSNGEQGVFYDPFDMSTMYQDAAGTIPVTAIGQPVGLMLDKSKGLVLGSELIPQPLDFNNWVKTAAITSFTNNSFTTNAAGGCTLSIFGGSNTKTYKVQIKGTSTVAANIRNGSAGSIGLPISVGSFDITFISPLLSNVGSSIYIALGSAGTITFDSISVKEVMGNHAYQTVSASRPVLRQTPILGSELIVNGDFSNGTAGWTSAQNATISVTNGVLRVTNDAVTTSYGYAWTSFPTTVGKTYYVTARRIASSTSRTTNIHIGTGSAFNLISNILANGNANTPLLFTATTATTYIGLNANSNTLSGWIEYDDISVKELLGYRTDQNYLEFDGADDLLVTNNIDFTSTDKVSLFAGVRKLNDANANIIVEFSDTIVKTGTFNMQAPDIGGLSRYSAKLNGNVDSGQIVAISPSNYPAPKSNVVTSKFDISAQDKKEIELRVDSVVVGNAITPLSGTWSFGNYPLYIGRRGGTALPFNGHLYSLIVMGRLASDTETAVLENAIAKQVGVTLNV